MQLKYAGRFMTAYACLILTISGCTSQVPQNDADVIVAGAGIAGLSAALEASAAGTSVLLVDINSVGGGHAVMAGGLALVGTPLQESRGIHDTPEIAYRDLMRWGEDSDPGWVRFYTENSLAQVYDWLTDMGVVFRTVIPTPDASVPRFHFTGGTAVNVVVPMMREVLKRQNIVFLRNSEVQALIADQGRISGIRIKNTRTGEMRLLRAPAVILATGGFQNNLAMVRDNWRAGLPQPERLLTGAGQFANGDGIALARSAGAALSRMDHQVSFVNGVPDPRDGTGRSALVAGNPAAIWVNASGQRFINESAPGKEVDGAVLSRQPGTHWLIFDSKGQRRLMIRDAPGFTREAIRQKILDTPGITQTARSIPGLATATGLPPRSLQETVDRYNELVARHHDTDFNRFEPGDGTSPVSISVPPYYAIRLFPLTRKSMGGVLIDRAGRVLDGNRQPVPGLFAAGELTGVAGINGSYGGSGTFLGPSVLTGRVAGKTAADSVSGHSPVTRDRETASRTDDVMSPKQLEALLWQNRPGYWHFKVTHALVLERETDCSRCHNRDWPTHAAVTPLEQSAQLASCTECH